jgi:outer membrane biogenesis lipoprotein LolB
MIRAGRWVVGRRWRSVLQGSVLAALALLAACSKNPPPDMPDPNSPEGDVAFVIENRRSDDVVVELVRDGQRQRLGLITAQNRSVFTLRWSQVVNASRLVLSIHPIGSTARYTTEALILRPGSEVDLTVNQVLRQSVVSVY